MFITIEGIDGSGKTSLARGLHSGMKERGDPPKLAAEPTDSWLGHLARQGLERNLSKLAQALLFSADRAEHAKDIREILKSGSTLICDRYADSTIAYQSVGLSTLLPHPLEFLARLQWALFPRPDVTLWIDIEPRIGLGRLKTGPRKPDKAERDALLFLEAVRENYQELARSDPARWVRLDGMLSRIDLVDQALRLLLQRSPRPGRQRSLDQTSFG